MDDQDESAYSKARKILTKPDFYFRGTQVNCDGKPLFRVLTREEWQLQLVESEESKLNSLSESAREKLIAAVEKIPEAFEAQTLQLLSRKNLSQEASAAQDFLGVLLAPVGDKRLLEEKDGKLVIASGAKVDLLRVLMNRDHPFTKALDGISTDRKDEAVNMLNIHAKRTAPAPQRG